MSTLRLWTYGLDWGEEGFVQWRWGSLWTLSALALGRMAGMEGLYAKLQEVRQREEELAQLLADPEVVSDRQRFAELMREYSKVGEIVEVAGRLEELRERLARDRRELEEVEEEELRDFLSEEISRAEAEIAQLEQKLQRLLLPHDPDDDRNVILEIRAGAGGEEAALFAADLMRMYLRFAERQGWEAEVLDLEETGLKGVKSATILIKGRGAYGMLRFESGVHRVQRIPETESSGRIHTSTATVAVLPEVEDVEVEIDEKELRIDTFRASGAGGQHVNKTSSAVRITHLPTGIVVSCQQERSQHQNRERALQILKAKLYQMEQERKRSELDQMRRSQVGTGERSEKIRTYNFPQNRVTDHRINFTTYNLQEFLDGELDEHLEALRAYEQTRRLAELMGEKSGG